nr:hypothetical protein [Tanacetum cinerariifolium]
MEKTTSDIHELVELVPQLVRIVDSVAPPLNAATKGEKESQAQSDPAIEIPTIAQGEQQSSNEEPPIRPITFDSIPFEQFTTNLFSSSSSEFSHTPPPSMTDKGNGISKTSDDDKLKQILSYMKKEGSAPNLLNLCQFRTVREGPLTLEKAKVAAQAGKFGIPPSPQLITFELPPLEKKRKRRAEVIQEVFVTKNTVVDGMHRNLIPPVGVVGSVGLAINEPESGIFSTMAALIWSFKEKTNFI